MFKLFVVLLHGHVIGNNKIRMYNIQIFKDEKVCIYKEINFRAISVTYISCCIIGKPQTRGLLKLV